MCSGANPHVVMSTGEDLSLTAYESFCNLNPRHVEVLLETATANHFKECWPEEETIQDIKEEVSDAFEEMQHMADHGVFFVSFLGCHSFLKLLFLPRPYFFRTQGLGALLAGLLVKLGTPSNTRLV